MKDTHNTTWTSAPSHLDDPYWRRVYAGQILAPLIAGENEYRIRIEELYDGLEKFARSMADELVSEMTRTDREVEG